MYGLIIKLSNGKRISAKERLKPAEFYTSRVVPTHLVPISRRVINYFQCELSAKKFPHLTFFLHLKCSKESAWEKFT